MDTKNTYKLLHPKTKNTIGEFKSASVNGAARKAATRGHTNIHLRKAQTNSVSVYAGKKTKLKEPKIVNKGGNVIKFSYETTVKPKPKDNYKL